MTRPPAYPLPLRELPDHADEVVLALPDLDGRLPAVRLDTSYFLEEVAGQGYGGCSYLLACDVEMQTGPGYAWSPEDEGFGDLRLQPDPRTLRVLPWEPRTALVLADAVHADGTPVEVAPRTVLRRQLDRLADRGLSAWCGTELEFLVFDTTYQRAWESSYHRLAPSGRFNLDYALVGTEGLEPLARRIRREMTASGMRVESARAECHPGQYEIVFRYDEALATCDQHVVYKTGAKQIAAQEGRALTFMAKYDEGEGNSCHVHVSLRDRHGRPVFADDPATLSRFVAGQTAYLPELMLLFAPHVNSYKRLQPGAFAPSTASWGEDDRLSAVRTVGSGTGRRLEHRVAGGDANPYLVVAAVLAAGLQGIDEGLQPDPVRGRSGVAAPDLPRTLEEAVQALAGSGLAPKAFGQEVVDHLLAGARAEVAAHRRSVTDWERRRGFERL